MDNNLEQWQKQLSNVIYRDWQREEEELKNQIVKSLPEEDAFLVEADQYHEEHKRCAFVMVIRFNREGIINDVEGFIADELTVMELLPFEPVKDALAHYDTQSELCSVIVRNSEAVVERIHRP